MPIQKLKTVFSTGAWLNKVKTFYDKINEIIDYLNDNDNGYDVFEGSISQSGTNAPTWVVAKDTIGITQSWTYVDVGYYAIIDSIFTSYTNVVVEVSQSSGHASGLANAYADPVVARYEAIVGGLVLYTYDSEAGTTANDKLIGSYIRILAWN